MGLVYVTATIVAKEGCEEALEKELSRVVPDVRKEAGCIRYDLHRSDYGYVFLFYEVWESRPHLAAHGKTPHMAAMREATVDLVAGPAEVNTWEAVDAAN